MSSGSPSVPTPEKFAKLRMSHARPNPAPKQKRTISNPTPAKFAELRMAHKQPNAAPRVRQTLHGPADARFQKARVPNAPSQAPVNKKSK